MEFAGTLAAAFGRVHCDENDIIDYLKGCPGTFVSGKEIARKVGGRELYDKDRGWAIPILTQLVRRGIVETDHLGHFRLMLETKKKKEKEQHISPQILNILKSSGKSFDGITLEEEAQDDNPVPSYPKTERQTSPGPAGFKPDGGDQS